MFNVNLIGNLGRDAEMVTSKQGNDLIKLALAVNTGADDKALWFDVLLRNRPNLFPHLVKGVKVFVQGDCKMNTSNGYINLNVFATSLALVGDAPAAQPAPASTCVPNDDPLYGVPGSPAI